MGARPNQPTAITNIPDGLGTLYSFRESEGIKCQRTKVGLSNGLAFDYQRKKMYYADSFRKTVDQYDFDIQTGTIGELYLFVIINGLLMLLLYQH